jgi:RNA polymerase sigma factor (sigma-70 family)
VVGHAPYASAADLAAVRRPAGDMGDSEQPVPAQRRVIHRGDIPRHGNPNGCLRRMPGVTPEQPTRVFRCVLTESDLAVTTFVVVTDCKVLQSGFEAVADSYGDLELAGVAGFIDDPESLVLRTGPDVVLIDYGLGDDRALQVCRAITKFRPQLPVLVISGVISDAAVRGCIESGARGFLYKDVDTRDLRDAIKRLAAGESVLDPRVTGRVILWASRHEFDTAPDTLSPREAEVVRRVAQGESNKEIAERLGLSQNTIKTYLRRAYRKLDTRTRSGAAALVARRGTL